MDETAGDAAVIQTVQRVLHARVIMPALAGRAITPPRPLAWLLRRVPGVAVVPALLLGVGPRPERVPAFARRP